MYRKTVHTGGIMNANELRAKIKRDVFSYLELTDLLASYGNIRNKIQRLLNNGEIIRIKKGIYTFPESLRRAPLNPCTIANILYGPSYVSCDYALAHYGLIPESVAVVTSMTTGRPREFNTPFGSYKYYQRQSSDYSVGVKLENECLIASVEKAIYDKALTDCRFDGVDIVTYLEKDLRLDLAMLPLLDRDLLHSLARVASGRMKQLVTFLVTL